MSEEERLSISGSYYYYVTGEIGRAQNAYRLLASTYPRSSAAHNMLGAVAIDTGNVEEGTREYQEAIRRSPDSVAFYTNLAHA